jgi:hypothetical protein
MAFPAEPVLLPQAIQSGKQNTMQQSPFAEPEQNGKN